MANILFECSCGEFTVELNEDWAPNGVTRFKELLEDNFFEGLRFFRVVTQPRPFIIQFGIHGDPKVSAVWREKNIKDDPVKTTNAEGTLTFATAGPNTRTTQFFINLGDNDFLDGQGFSPIGKIVDGMDTVRAICDTYGEAPDQGAIQSKGSEYLEAQFPELDFIVKTTIQED